MQRGRLRLYGAGDDLRGRIAAIRRAAGAGGVDLAPFRLLMRADAVAAAERRVDPRRVAAEQREFTEALLRHFASAWEQVASRGSLASLVPYIEFWLREVGRGAREFEADCGRDAGAALGECRSWLETWFAASAFDARDGTGEAAAVMEQFMRLALLAGVPFFHLGHLRRAIAIQRQGLLLGEALTRNGGQLTDGDEPAEAILEALADRRAAELGRHEGQLDLLRRALLMELVPLEAARLEIAAGDLRRITGEVARVVGLPAPAADAWQPADAALADAHDFYRACLDRGAHMADETLRLMRARGHDRAVLAVGGFHPDVIGRRLEADRRASFSVLLPVPSLGPPTPGGPGQ
jgi:hypothetical protein